MKFLITTILAILSVSSHAQVQKAYEQYVPTGAIMAFALNACPTGYLLADGTPKNRSDYPRLFASMGTIHGTTTATNFLVPDYRGRFLRMIDGSAGNDPDKTGRTAMATGGASGNSVGSIQASASRAPIIPFTGTAASAGNHTHSTDYYWWTNDTGNSHATSTYNLGGHMGRHGFSTNTNRGDVIALSSGAHTHSVSVNGGGDAESRPVNAYVIYCIKI